LIQLTTILNTAIADAA